MNLELARLNEELHGMLALIASGPEQRARQLHAAAMITVKMEGEIAKQMALAEIRKMFLEAFPNRYYAFLVKRPRDTDPWPLVFSNQELANNYEHRLGPVVEVRL